MIFRNRYFSLITITIVFLIGVSYTKLSVELANYFLSHPFSYTLSGILLFLVFVPGAFILTKNLKIKHPIFLYLSIILLICEMFSFHFLFYLKSYSLYFSVILFSHLTFFLILSGFLAGQIIQKSESDDIKYGQALIVSIIMAVIAFSIPDYNAFTFIPYFLPLPVVLFYVWLYIEDKSHSFYTFSSIGIYLVFLFVAINLPAIKTFSSQAEFEDKVVLSEDSDKNSIVLTQWMDDHWLFLNRLKYISTIDEFLFYEPMVHVTSSFTSPGEVLIIGGENGCAAREMLKYQSVNSITIVPNDPTLLTLCKMHPVLSNMNKNSLLHEKITIESTEILSYILNPDNKFDIIIIDLPDPRNLESNQYYTLEFYNLISQLLTDNGIFITQAGSPYFATKAFKAIQLTIENAGFQTLPIHNQILTLGEWGWILGSKNQSRQMLKDALLQATYANIETKWLNQEANFLLTSFGKEYKSIETIKVNTIDNPVVYRYYLEGTWDLN